MEGGLQAYTESAIRKDGDPALKLKAKGKGKGKDKGGRGGRDNGRDGRNSAKGKYSSSNLRGGRAARQPAKLEFDEAARTEFLTGFRKRKNARKEKARLFLEEQKKAEVKANKKDAVEARKERARENVIAERTLFGDKYEGGMLLDSEQPAANQGTDEAEAEEEEYDSDQHFTTVVVQDWNPDQDETAPVVSARWSRVTASDKGKQKTEETGRRKPRGTGSNMTDLASGPDPPPIAAAEQITDLLDPESTVALREADEILSRHAGPRQDESGGGAAANSKPKKFHYESVAERKAQREKIKAKRGKLAERRRSENLEAIKAGSKKSPGKLKKSGKRGKGGIGSSGKKKKSSS